MSFFDGVDLCECVGCGCDDENACAGGCSWVQISDSGRRGICDACLEAGIAFVIAVHWEKAFPEHWAAQTLQYETHTTAGKKAAVSGVARKQFGPGSRIYWMTECCAVAVPARARPDLAPGAASRGFKRPRRTAAGARARPRTRASAATSAGG